MHTFLRWLSDSLSKKEEMWVDFYGVYCIQIAHIAHTYKTLKAYMHICIHRSRLYNEEIDGKNTTVWNRDLIESTQLNSIDRQILVHFLNWSIIHSLIYLFPISFFLPLVRNAIMSKHRKIITFVFHFFMWHDAYIARTHNNMKHGLELDVDLDRFIAWKGSAPN